MVTNDLLYNLGSLEAISRSSITNLLQIVFIFGSMGQLYHVHTDLQNFRVKIISLQKVQKYVLVSGKNKHIGQGAHTDPQELSDKNFAAYVRIL